MLKVERELGHFREGLGDEMELRWALVLLARECVRYESELPAVTAAAAAG